MRKTSISLKICMLQNRIGMKVSPFRIFKNYKYVFKSNITKSYFFEKNFILFYYYDIMSFQQQGIIQKKLLDNGLKYYKLKKKLLKNFIFENNLNYFQNLFENNVLIVYNFKDEDLIFIPILFSFYPHLILNSFMKRCHNNFF